MLSIFLFASNANADWYENYLQGEKDRKEEYYRSEELKLQKQQVALYKQAIDQHQQERQQQYYMEQAFGEPQVPTQREIRTDCTKDANGLHCSSY
jgi:hypothetical protein